jgi:hypothetical protein
MQCHDLVAKLSHIETVEDAAISRLRPMQDGVDF